MLIRGRALNKGHKVHVRNDAMMKTMMSNDDDDDDDDNINILVTTVMARGEGKVYLTKYRINSFLVYMRQQMLVREK